MESIDIYEMLSKNAHEFMEIVMLRVEIFFLFKKKKCISTYGYFLWETICFQLLCMSIDQFKTLNFPVTGTFAVTKASQNSVKGA